MSVRAELRLPASEDCPDPDAFGICGISGPGVISISKGVLALRPRPEAFSASSRARATAVSRLDIVVRGGLLPRDDIELFRNAGVRDRPHSWLMGLIAALHQPKSILDGPDTTIVAVGPLTAT
jgi:hypothetical protein